MKSYGSPVNNKDQKCGSYTSTCLLWDGPNIDISCLGVFICAGQSINPILYQSYKNLCTVLEEINLDGFDLECISKYASNTPSIRDLFDYIITEVCEIKTKLDKFQNQNFDNLVDLPFCLQYTNAQGSVVTKVTLTEYYELVASKICNALSGVLSAKTAWGDIDDIEAELDEIQVEIDNQCNQEEQTVQLTCTNNATLNPANDPVRLQLAFEWIEKAFCQFKNFTGDVKELKYAIAKDCPNMGNLDKLYGTGVMNTYYGWIDNPLSLAESVNNLWITVCDMRNALRGVLEDCCNTPCTNFKVDYELVFDPNNTYVDIIFYGKTVIKSTPLFTNMGPVTSGGPIVGNSYTFLDPAQNFSGPNNLVGYEAKITYGRGVGQTAPITSYFFNSVTVNTANTNWVQQLNATSKYSIIGNYDGTTPAPVWVNTIYPPAEMTNVIITLDDGTSTYTQDTGDIMTNLMTIPGGYRFVYPTNYDYTALFKTITISFDYKFANPSYPGDFDCNTCECCCSVNLTNGIY